MFLIGVGKTSILSGEICISLRLRQVLKAERAIFLSESGRWTLLIFYVCLLVFLAKGAEGCIKGLLFLTARGLMNPAAAVPANDEIRVKTVDELLAAIGPDRTIVLNGRLFDLSAASGYGSVAGEYWFWQESYDGPALVIQGVSGLTIKAADKDPKETVLSAVPRYADVLSFRSCSDICLTGFTAGHTKEPGSCSGGVLFFQDCDDIRVEDCRLYGCGVLGVQCSNCSSFTSNRTEIYECSQGAVYMYMTKGIHFSECDIHDVPSPAFCLMECGDAFWNSEPMLADYYDITEDGSLIEYSYDYGYDSVYVPAAVLDNPFSYEDPVAFDRSSAAFAFAAAAQQMVARGDWEALAGRLIYPLPVFGEYGTSSFADRTDFLAADPDSILTEDEDNAKAFVAQVNSAAVYVNCSTRFTDGSELGLGAEIAISTQPLHARGPMALRELTTYKWVIRGDYNSRK